MPYRRLPNTDKSRLFALHAIIDNNDNYTVDKRVIDRPTLGRAERACRQLETAVEDLRAMQLAVGSGQNYYYKLMRIARLYISHFLQVLLMSIMRGEIKEDKKILYGLAKDATSIPSLSSEAELAEWGHKVIEGEKLRLKGRGMPIYNPNIAKVAVHYDAFKRQYDTRMDLLLRVENYRQKLIEVRRFADEVISAIWDQVEEHYASLPPKERYFACKAQGLIYYYRTNEPHLYE